MENTKKCPFCSEEIKIEAKKCRFCGEWLNEENNDFKKSKVTENNDFDIFHEYENFLLENSDGRYKVFKKSFKSKTLTLEMKEKFDSLTFCILIILYIIPGILYLIVISKKIKVIVKFNDNGEVLFSSKNSYFLKDKFNSLKLGEEDKEEEIDIEEEKIEVEEKEIKIEEEKESFSEKHGKKILYGVGIITFLSSFSGISNGNYDLLYNIISGLTIIFALQSHTALISRLNLGKPLLYKEVIFLILGTIIFIFSLSLPSKVILENPLIIIPWIIYILIYIFININYLINKEKDLNNTIDTKIKIINILIHFIIFITILITSFFYKLSDNQSILNNQNIEEFLGSFFGAFIMLYLLSNYIYRKGRGKLGGTIKKNLLLILRGIYGVIVIVLLIILFININYSRKEKKTFNDLNNISNIAKSNSSDFNSVVNGISNMKIESNLGKSIQNYMIEKSNINNIYQKEINELGEVILDSKNYANISEINNIITNLNKLGNITKEYKDNIDKLNEKINLKDFLNTSSVIEKENEFIQAENEFIQSSKDVYNYLLEIQNEIQIDENGEIGIYDDYIRNSFNELIRIMNVKINNYDKKSNELEELRQKALEKLNK